MGPSCYIEYRGIRNRAIRGFYCICYIFPVMVSAFLRLIIQRCKCGWGLHTLRLMQNGQHFAGNIFLNENVWILLKISLKFVNKVRINNIPALVQIMAWRWPGNKPLSEPMMVRLLMHICVTRPQWVKNTKQTTDESTSKSDIFVNLMCNKTNNFKFSVFSHEISGYPKSI